MYKHNIMVVDDDKRLLKLLNKALELANYNVSTFESAKSAFKSLDESIPDLIISDLMMPGISGIEFCKMCKADKRVANTPFIILTAFNDKKFLISGLDAGATDYLVKPINFKVFLPKIAAILKQVNTTATLFSVLLVDSSPVLLNVTKRKLLEAGFFVTTANRADDAIECIHTRIYNLIISGVELKGMDGLHFCKHLKGSVFKETPFVLFTGKISNELLEKGVAAGVNDFWEKTVSPEGLVAKVKAVARQHDFSKDFQGGLEGHLTDMSSLELIQTIGINKKTGILSLIGPDLEGHIHFCDGNITDAATAKSKGESAFFSLITLASHGSFHFIPTECEKDIVIKEGFQGLLMEGAKLLDDMGRILGQAIIATEKKPKDIDKEEETFFSHIDGKQTFEIIIGKSCVEPYRGFEILKNLVSEGFVHSPLEEEENAGKGPDDLF
ncbi:MAG: response regulator [Deltaproteobacteria bacterium]|nr:response regulator [Deltaproteobacteria bacterium]